MPRILCFPLLIALSQVAIAATPQNPLLSEDAFYVSNQGIHRFDRQSLKLQWSALQGMQTFDPVLGDRLVYVGSPQGLYALDRDSGATVWRIEGNFTIFSPTVGEQLFAGSLHGVLYSIDSQDGSINWKSQFTGWIYSPVLFGERNQLWTGGQAHQAYALSSKDGRRLHTLTLGQESIFSPMRLDDRRVAFNLFNGKTTIIDTESASTHGSLDGNTQPNDLTFDERMIYRSGRDGSLTAFDRDSYRQAWRKSILGQNLSLHPATKGRILMSDRDRTLVWFDSRNGREIDRFQITGEWFSPIQSDENRIVYFRSTNMKPSQLSAVQILARPH